jgi:Ca2+-binding RTX toxin-like protein
MATIQGTNGADIITPGVITPPLTAFPGNGADSISALDGHDSVDGGGDADTLLGGLGNDTLFGNDGNDRLEGSFGDNRLLGGQGDDTLTAEKDRDTMLGGAGADSLAGMANHDRLFGEAGHDTLDGGDEDDGLDGGADNDLLLGGNGADSLLGGDGLDTLQGGQGADTLSGGTGLDGLFGEAGNDSLLGGGEADALEGGAGADTLSGLLASYSLATTGVLADLAAPAGNSGDAAGDVYVGTTQLRGSAFDDTLRGNGAGNVLAGLAGNDSLVGGAGIDWLSGGEDADTLDGGFGGGTLDGGSGDDLLFATLRSDGNAGLSAEYLYGGDGRDRISLERISGDPIGSGAGLRTFTRFGVDLTTGDIRVDLGGAFTTVDLTVVLLDMDFDAGRSLVEDAIGSGIGDLIRGSSLANLLEGREGADTLRGESGADTLRGGNGHDRLEGGNASDLLEGEAGDDTLSGTGLLPDTLDGGEGNDLASFAEITVGLTVSLADPTRNAGGAAGEVLISIEHLEGGQVGDGLYGDAGGNLLRGGGGGDTLDGAAGADTLIGGEGDDLLLLGPDLGGGMESVDGGAGRDRVDLSGVTSPPLAGFVVTLGGLAAIRDFGITLVEIAANSVEDIIGSRFNDVLAAAEIGSFLDGGDGDDELVGFGGADTLIGGDGSDHLEGGEGRDLVSYEFATQAARVFTSFGQRSQNAGAALGDTLSGVEDLRGTAFDDQLTGSGSLANQLEGLAGADTLVGGAGDTLIGGTGADVYVLNDPGAVIVEVADGSRSSVHANYVLPGLFEGFHDLTLLGSVRNGIGNGLDNRITGNAAANILDGGDGADTLDGGGGADVLVGGAGLDVFIVDHRRDIVVDDEGDGGHVQASVSWTLGDDLAELRLTGTQAIDGTGNAGANRLTGNGVANRLDGRDGADTINAGSGDDLLLGGAGRDRLRGDGGADTLDGGLEKDTLTGSAGADLFLVTTRPGDLFDSISDFAAEDRIGVLLSAFDLAGTSGLVAGSLAGQGSRLEQNLTGHATLAETRFVYDTDSGQLYFDADGAGGAARAIVVRLASAPAALQPDDIFLL